MCASLVTGLPVDNMSIMFDGNPDTRVVFAAPEPKDSRPISVGAIVGIAVGGALLVLLGATLLCHTVITTSRSLRRQNKSLHSGGESLHRWVVSTQAGRGHGRTVAGFDGLSMCHSMG